MNRHASGLAVVIVLLTVMLLPACRGRSAPESPALDKLDASPLVGTPSQEGRATERTVTLSWTMPTARIDGSAVRPSEIEGYRVYHGHDRGQLELMHVIENAYDRAWTTGQLSAGSHYFSVTAVDTYGTESARSNIEAKTIVAIP